MIWLVISAIVRTIAMGFIIFLGVYLAGTAFGTNVTAKNEDDFTGSMLVFAFAGAIFYLFQFVLPI